MQFYGGYACNVAYLDDDVSDIFISNVWLVRLPGNSSVNTILLSGNPSLKIKLM